MRRSKAHRFVLAVIGYLWFALAALYPLLVAARALISEPPEWLRTAPGVAAIALVLVGLVSGTEMLRVYGARPVLRGGPVVLALAWAVCSFGPGLVGGYPPPFDLVNRVLMAATGLLVMLSPLAADWLVARAGRRAEWEVLRGQWRITAAREPLTRDEALARAPEFAAMLEDLARFRERGTAEFLDRFDEVLRWDVLGGPAPADPAATLERLDVLRAGMAGRFGPYRTWIPTAPRPRTP